MARTDRHSFILSYTRKLVKLFLFVLIFRNKTLFCEAEVVLLGAGSIPGCGKHEMKVAFHVLFICFVFHLVDTNLFFI